MLKPVKYWYEKLGLLQELDDKLQSVIDMLLLKYPDDYLEARKSIQKAINQNRLNKQYIRQEISTIEATERGEI